jgi:RHS repeat-associated protein
VTGETGEILASFAYGPYGSRLASTGEIEVSYLWHGRFGARAEGDLYEMRARYYDPALGRFVTPDPVGGSSPRSINPYQAFFAAPTLYVDPLGTNPSLVTRARNAVRGFFGIPEGGLEGVVTRGVESGIQQTVGFLLDSLANAGASASQQDSGEAPATAVPGPPAQPARPVPGPTDPATTGSSGSARGGTTPSSGEALPSIRQEIRDRSYAFFGGEDTVPLSHQDGTSGYLLAFILWGYVGVDVLNDEARMGESDVQNEDDSARNRAYNAKVKGRMLATEGLPHVLPAPPESGSPAPEGAADLPPQPFNGTSLPGGSWEPESFRESPQMRYQRCIQLDEYEG